jgi:formate hydrogenlyase regulatory protein HycA
MAIPKTIRIRHEPNYRTHNIGTCGDGRQFMAFVVATLASERRVDVGPGKRWYAVLHTFDARGNHLDTQAWFAGTTEDGEEQAVERARRRRQEMLASLGSHHLGNVQVKLFSVEIDGAVFGLVDTSEGGRDRVTLYPNDLLFTPPWRGTYST